MSHLNISIYLLKIVEDDLILSFQEEDNVVEDGFLYQFMDLNGIEKDQETIKHEMKISKDVQSKVNLFHPTIYSLFSKESLTYLSGLFGEGDEETLQNHTILIDVLSTLQSLGTWLNGRKEVDYCSSQVIERYLNAQVSNQSNRNSLSLIQILEESNEVSDGGDQLFDNMKTTSSSLIRDEIIQRWFTSNRFLASSDVSMNLKGSVSTSNNDENINSIQLPIIDTFHWILSDDEEGKSMIEMKNKIFEIVSDIWVVENGFPPYHRFPEISQFPSIHQDEEEESSNEEFEIHQDTNSILLTIEEETKLEDNNIVIFEEPEEILIVEEEEEECEEIDLSEVSSQEESEDGEDVENSLNSSLALTVEENDIPNPFDGSRSSQEEEEEDDDESDIISPLIDDEYEESERDEEEDEEVITFELHQMSFMSDFTEGIDDLSRIEQDEDIYNGDDEEEDEEEDYKFPKKFKDFEEEDWNHAINANQEFSFTCRGYDVIISGENTQEEEEKEEKLESLSQLPKEFCQRIVVSKIDLSGNEISSISLIGHLFSSSLVLINHLNISHNKFYSLSKTF